MALCVATTAHSVSSSSPPLLSVVNASIFSEDAFFVKDTALSSVSFQTTIAWQLAPNTTDALFVRVSARPADTTSSPTWSESLISLAATEGCAEHNLTCVPDPAHSNAIIVTSVANHTAGNGFATVVFNVTLPANPSAAEGKFAVRQLSLTAQGDVVAAPEGVDAALPGTTLYTKTNIPLVFSPSSAPATYQRVLSSFCEYQLWQHVLSDAFKLLIDSDPLTDQAPAESSGGWIEPYTNAALSSLQAALDALTAAMPLATSTSQAPAGPALFAARAQILSSPLMPQSHVAHVLADAFAFVDTVSALQLDAEVAARAAGPRGNKCGDGTCDLAVESCSCSDCQCSQTDLTWSGNEEVAGHWDQTQLWGGARVAWDIEQARDGRRFDMDLFSEVSYEQAVSLVSHVQ